LAKIDIDRAQLAADRTKQRGESIDRLNDTFGKRHFKRRHARFRRCSRSNSAATPN
jgi:hypothetical protein